MWGRVASLFRGTRPGRCCIPVEFWQTWESERERVLVSPLRARAASKKIQRAARGTASDKQCIHQRDEACAATQALLRAWRGKPALVPVVTRLHPSMGKPWWSMQGDSERAYPR